MLFNMKKANINHSNTIDIRLYKRFLFFLIIIFILSYNQVSCKKEPACACGVEHPEKNLSWLKENLAVMFNVDVYKLFHADTEYIIISSPPGPDEMSWIYNCEGVMVCEIGGFNPGDNFCDITSSPETFLENYAKRKLIFSK